MSIHDVVTLLGGLAMLLFGMGVMGDALKKSAGNKLKTILGNLTSNPIKGFLLGAVATIVMQSSSATTVMIVGFVNSGAMTLSQTIPLIIGANVGTTVTAWLTSTVGIPGEGFLAYLKPSFFSPILAVIGLVLYMFAKRDKQHDIGCALLGFGVMMFGMETMSGAVANIPREMLSDLFVTLGKNPVLAVLAGTGVTAIIQSSAASVGMLQALSSSGAITIAAAIPIVMGQNIGTCATAMLSSIGANKNAKRTAMIHLTFNIIGTVIFLAVFLLLGAFVPAFADWTASSTTPVGIAAIHTVYKILCAIVIAPFSFLLEKIACLLIRDKKGQNEKFELLDERLLETPAVAIEQCRIVENDMAILSCDIMKQSLDLFSAFNEKSADAVAAGEAEADLYEDKLGTYLVKLSAHPTSQSDSREISKLLHLIGDFERISDHAVNVLDSAREMSDKKIAFSEAAQAELGVLIRAVKEILDLSCRSFIENDLSVAAKVEPLEQVVDYLNAEIKKRHIQRLQAGECTIELGFILNDLLTNLERVSDHCSNIAVCLIEIAHDSFDTHEYLTGIKGGSVQQFNDQYTAYLQEFSL